MDGKEETNVKIKRTIDEKGKRVKSKDGTTAEREGGKIRERVVKRERRAHRNANATDPIKLHWVIERENTTYKRGVSRQNTIFIAPQSHAVLDSCVSQ